MSRVLLERPRTVRGRVAIALLKILGKPQRGVVFRLGTFSRVAGPGVVVLIPLLERMLVVNLDEAVPGWAGLPPRELTQRVKHHVLTSGAEGAALDRLRARLGPSTDAPTRQGYGFGWVFSIVMVAEFLLILETRGLWHQLMITVLFLPAAVAAAWRRPSSWYVVLSALALQFCGLVFLVARQPPATWFERGLMLGVGALLVLSFGYFYRCRAMFGAKSRWHWLESRLPLVVGPEVFIKEDPLADLRTRLTRQFPK